MNRKDLRTAERQWRATPQPRHRAPAAPPPRDRITWRHVLGYVIAGLSAYVLITVVLDVLRGL